MPTSLAGGGAVALEDPRQLGRVLRPASTQQVADTLREDVEGPLADVLSHRWRVRWERAPGRPHTARVLSDPVVHLTAEAATDETGAAAPLHGHPTPTVLLHGLVPEVFEVELPVAGVVHGLAFHPGGLSVLTGTAARAWAGRVLPAGDVLEVATTDPDADDPWQPLVEAVARRHDPAAVAADAGYRLVRRAFALVEDPGVRTVEALATRLHVSARTLQRVFLHHVGAGPLWVLRRRRLQQAAAALDLGR
ncbi:DUF6597 domain-containing transcriptional factor, partial [Desertihabitans aurantiacus]|uniref:DUF6597 domain-containing transcriptional factor n=1 Tax=Desertihabitans aurantiacus TaxID=2282477 RepID=UPI000DF7FBC6